MEVTQEMLQASGNTAISSAIYGEDGGFDFGSGQTMTQRMLASSFADDDGEMWQSVFGADEPANINEMTQAQLIKHMATRTYANADWLAKLNRLSTKGLVMEYLQQQAEINYMLAMLKDLKLQTIQQKALLARVTTVGQDKNLDGLAESIHVDYNPNFMDLDLLASGDEWIGGASPYNSPQVGSHGLGVDISDLPNDLNGLLDALLEAAAHGEAKSPEAYNNGTSPCGLSKSKPNGDGVTFITRMTPIEIISRGKTKDCKIKLFATGIWQTIPDTLNGAINAMPELKNQPYTRENQKKVALWLILQDPARKKLSNFLTGKNDDVDGAQHIMSMIWASIPAPKGKKISKNRVSDGTMSYHESKSNHANQQSGVLVRAVLMKIKEYHSSQKSQKQ